eukprot:scaffold20885_cov58-Phaeocystis_antarctica.AAC.8
MLTSLRSITSFCVRRLCSSITFSLSRCVIRSWNACRAGPTSPDKSEANTGSAGQQTAGLRVGSRFEWRPVTCSGTDAGAEVFEVRAELFDLVRGPLAQVLVVCRLIHVLGLGLGEIRHRVLHELLPSLREGEAREYIRIRETHRKGRDASVASRTGQRCRGDRTVTTGPRAHLYLRPTGGVTGRFLRQPGGRGASGQCEK